MADPDTTDVRGREAASNPLESAASAGGRMANVPDIDVPDVSVGSTTDVPRTEPAGKPYVRAPRPRITQPAINDLADDDDLAASGYTHDSDFTSRGGLSSGRGYRRSRSDMNQLRRDLHYGQYLEIPKGRRDIFAKRERASRVKSLLAAVVVIALVFAVGYLVVQFLQASLG